MAARCSLVLVNYKTAALAREAIRSAHAASTAPLQVVVVDNSCDPAEAEALRCHADVVVVSGTNRGYAGGINLGRGSCDGEVLIGSESAPLAYSAKRGRGQITLLAFAPELEPFASWSKSSRDRESR